MDGIGGVGGVGGVGMIGGVGGFGSMGGAAASPSMGAGSAAQPSGIGASDVTVSISGASVAALAADSQQSMSTNAVQPANGNNSMSLVINAPSSISSMAWQDLQNTKEWNNLIADLLLAMLLQQMQKK